MTFTSWRTNINFIGAIMVTPELPPTLMGNYHLLDNTSPAYNLGEVSKTVGALTVSAPTFDIDGDSRPAFGRSDSGADEIPAPKADLSITKTDGVTSVNQGATVTYTIVASNAGPNDATAIVTDNFPAGLTNVSWSCAGVATCPSGTLSGNINATISLSVGSSATFTVIGTASTAGSLSNTAAIASADISDPDTTNNSATDTDTVVPSMHVGDLDVTTINANNNNATNWNAEVTITVHNGADGLLSGSGSGQSITVNGTWSSGGSGSGSCTINNNSGQCTVTRTGLSKATNPSVTFTVTGITKTGYVYQSAANHDPDGDSTGTAITASRLTMQVASLTSIVSGASPWQTNVTVTVRDSNGNLVPNASVSGSWSNGTGTGSNGNGNSGCTTSSVVGPNLGTCTVIRTSIASTRTSVIFTVSGVTKSSGSPAVVYQAGSTTTITVAKP
jgi:uncharacterized repeat protein (TIGR01451 family)